jgi:hypothetical protein
MTVEVELCGGLHDGARYAVSRDIAAAGELLLVVPAPVIWGADEEPGNVAFRKVRYTRDGQEGTRTSDGALRFIFDPRNWA